MEQWWLYLNANMQSQNINEPNQLNKPIDQGVIYTFESWYCKYLLKSLICKLDNFSSARQFASAISVLDAVNWIALACDNVKPECVQNCFRKAGFLQMEKPI